MVTPKYQIDGTVPSYLNVLAQLDKQGFPPVPTFAVTVTNATLLNLAHLFNWLQNHDRDGFVQRCNLELDFGDDGQPPEAMVARVKALLAPEDWRGRIKNRDTLFPNDRNPDRRWAGQSRRVLPMLSLDRDTCVTFAHPVGKLIGSADQSKFDLHWAPNGDRDFQVADAWDDHRR
ncbi:MAG: hypothetical protein LBG60_04570 [Bifidobacteriaceae bacterium]|jgi:hypothetical protein|nr:hypothetical protein [Bifidobacteriaceae bacterium]